MALLRGVLLSQRRALLRTVTGIAGYMVCFYVPFVYLATGLQNRGGWAMSGSLGVTTIALLELSLLSPMFGWIADRVGTRRLLLGSTALLGLLSIPLLLWIEHGGAWSMLVGLGLLALLFAPMNALVGIPLSLQFPMVVRGTAFALGFNLSAAFFGGLAPLAADLLVNQTGTLSAAGIVMVLGACLSMWAWYECSDSR